MVGEVREPAVGGRVGGALEGLADAEMELRPAQLREPVVEGPPHDLVGEPTGHPLRGELLDHSAADRFLEGGQELGLGQLGGPADRLELELRPGDGGELEQVGGARSQAREPLADHLADAFGGGELGQRPGDEDASVDYLDRPGLEQGAPELADQEGVASGEVVNRARELGQLGIAAEVTGCPADEVGDLGLREAREAHPEDIIGAPEVGQRLRQTSRHLVGLGVAEGDEDQEPGAPGGPRQKPQQEKRRHVRPVRVLEHQQHRPFAADVGEQVGDRGVKAVALGVGIGLDRLRQLARHRRQVGQQPGQLGGTGTERGPQLLRLGDADEAIERLDEGPVGRPHDRVAGAIEDQRPLGGGPGGELAGEAALPGSGLTGQQCDTPTLPLRPRHQGPQPLQLRRAPDERRGRNRAERVREARDLGVHGQDDSQI